MQSEQHYAIIGAGPMGLCTARQLKQYGIAFTGFELHSNVGGLTTPRRPNEVLAQRCLRAAHPAVRMPAVAGRGMTTCVVSCPPFAAPIASSTFIVSAVYRTRR